MVVNSPEQLSATEIFAGGWPALLALVLWVHGWIATAPRLRLASWVCAWTCLGWAALGLQNGAAGFLWIVMAFMLLHVVLPGLRDLWRLPRKPDHFPAPGESGATSAATVLLTAGLFLCGFGSLPARAGNAPPAELSIPDSVTQTIRVDDKYAVATAKIHWQAEKGQALPLLAAPAILTKATYPLRSLKLARGAAGSRFTQQLLVEQGGSFDIEVQYQVEIPANQSEKGFSLPVPYGLINQVNLTVVSLDVDVLSPQAVSIQSDHTTTNTTAAIVLSPADSWITWRPRSRDVRSEKATFFAETSQLFVPSAGVIEASAYVTIKPAHGELRD
ncbi:MAG: hypothetical protein ACRD5L_10520, partial [Bryobacteraceae bacterium]